MDKWFTLDSSLSLRGVENQILVYLYDGTGDNLMQEDRDAGFVGYLNYEIYDYNTSTGECKEFDGGMVLTTKSPYDMTEAECITALNDELFGEQGQGWITPENITEVDPSQLIGLDY